MSCGSAAEARLGLGLGLAFALGATILLRALLRRLIATLGLIVRLGFGFRLGKVIGRQQFPGGAGECSLVVGRPRHLFQRRLGLGGDGCPPMRQHAIGRDRGGDARHPLPRQQGECGAERKLLLPRHAVVAVGLALLNELLLKVGGDAGHVAAADSLDARLFQCIIDFTGFPAGRRAGGVDAIVMMTDAQRHGVGGAPQAGDLRRRQSTGGRGEARAGACQASRASLKGDLHLRLPRHRANRAGRGALERLAPLVAVFRSAHVRSLAGAAETAGRQLFVEAALVVFRDRRPLRLVAFVEEGEAEREVEVVEDAVVLGPGNDRAR